jgi:hypothetical protein
MTKEHDKDRYMNGLEKDRKTAAANLKTKTFENATLDDRRHQNNTQWQKKRENFVNFRQEPAPAAINVNQPNYYSSSDEDSSSAINDLFSNRAYCNDEKSELESEFEPDVYTHQTLKNMEAKMNAMTNRFVYRVKSEVDETFSKLRVQQKYKEKRQGKNGLKKDEKMKIPDRGAGDSLKHTTHSKDDDATFSMLQKKKMQAYTIIDQNIKVLQQVDHLAERLYKNHLTNLKK